MRREIFDIRFVDVRSLSLAQREALRRHLIRCTHRARAQAIRQIIPRILWLLGRLAYLIFVI